MLNTLVWCCWEVQMFNTYIEKLCTTVDKQLIYFLFEFLERGKIIID